MNKTKVTMSIFAAGFLMAGDLPQPLGFERYSSLLTATLFGLPSQPIPKPAAIRSAVRDYRTGRTRILLYDGRVIEDPPLPPPILEDGIMYPVLPPKRPK